MDHDAARPRYRLITYGCQMNKNDSERVAGLLNGLGFAPTDRDDEADVILVNTCSVRQSAEDRVFGHARAWKALKQKNPRLIVGVTGCLPGRDRNGAMRKKLAAVDLYFPIKDLPQLPRWIGELRPDLVNGTDAEEDYLKIRPMRPNVRQAFVTIQTGCNKFCTYCVVPFARGLEKNRPLRDILEEVRGLVERGCVEVTLLGQTVNSYRAPDPDSFSAANPFFQKSFVILSPSTSLRAGSAKDPSTGPSVAALPQDDKRGDHFAALLWEIDQIAGLKRLHFTAPHPLHMTDAVIEAMGLPAHVHYLHLPVQSGSDAVLRRMNRRHTAAQYLDVIARVKKRHPTMAIGTDIIVGFCGETVEDYEQTAALYKEVGFDISYTARYSPRSGTAAWRAFKDDVPRAEKKRRWDDLQKIQEDVVLAKNQAYVGQTVSVLVERHEPPRVTEEMLAMPGNIVEQLKKKPGTCFGNSREMKLVSFPGGKDLVGQIVDVKIDKAEMWILYGRQA